MYIYIASYIAIYGKLENCHLSSKKNSLSYFPTYS